MAGRSYSRALPYLTSFESKNSINRGCLRRGIIGQLLGAPVDEVAGVKGDAEEIGGDKPELGGAYADNANDGAIEGRDDPALPELLANEHGGDDGQHAGQIIESDDVEHVQHVVMTGE